MKAILIHNIELISLNLSAHDRNKFQTYRRKSRMINNKPVVYEHILYLNVNDPLATLLLIRNPNLTQAEII